MRQNNGIKVVFKHAAQKEGASLIMALTAVWEDEAEYMLPFPEYDLTLLFQEWNGGTDIQEIKNRDRWIDVRNFVRTEDRRKITFELWLMLKNEKIEVKLADYREEKGTFMCRGQYGSDICTYAGRIRPTQYLEKYVLAGVRLLDMFDSSYYGKDMAAQIAEYRKAMVFVTGLHPRLGAASRIRMLDDALVEKIVCYACP